MVRRAVVLLFVTVATAACANLLGIDTPGARTEVGPPADGGTEASPGGECAAPQVTCGTECVDVSVSDDHCGRCGHSCRGQGCEGGHCRAVERLTEATSILALVAGGGGVFWLDRSVQPATDYLGFVPNDAPPCHGSSCSVAREVRSLEASCLAWWRSDLYVGAGDRFLRFGRDRSLQDVLVGARPYECAADGDALVWITPPPTQVNLTYDGQTVNRLVTSEAARDFRYLTAQGGRVFFIDAAREGLIASVATNAYCEPNDCPILVSGPGLGIEAMAPAPRAGAIVALTHKDGELAVLRFPTAARCDRGFDCGVPLGSVLGPTNFDLTTDETFAYWLSGGAVLRARLDGAPCGSECGALLEGVEGLQRIAVDEDYVYAATYAPARSEQRSATILRVPK